MTVPLILFFLFLKFLWSNHFPCAWQRYDCVHIICHGKDNFLLDQTDPQRWSFPGGITSQSQEKADELTQKTIYHLPLKTKERSVIERPGCQNSFITFPLHYSRRLMHFQASSLLLLLSFTKKPPFLSHQLLAFENSPLKILSGSQNLKLKRKKSTINLEPAEKLFSIILKFLYLYLHEGFFNVITP